MTIREAELYDPQWQESYPGYRVLVSSQELTAIVEAVRHAMTCHTDHGNTDKAQAFKTLYNAMTQGED